MAEAAGLALGGIALASLITTCVEFVEYFEDCRNCSRDVIIAVTKVKLMKVRLDQLGSIGHLPVQGCLLDPNTEMIHHDWHHVSSALPDGASVIKDIIKETTQLCRRYSYDTCHGASIVRKCSPTAQTPSHQGPDPSGERLQSGRRAVLHTISRSVSWAFHDKKKFNGLISDFDSILSSLEKIIQGFQVKKTESHTVNITMANRSNDSKKLDGLQGRGLGAPAPRAYVLGEVHESTTPGVVSYEGNYSKDQSVHFVGPRVDGREEHTAVCRKSNSKDQPVHPGGKQVDKHEEHREVLGANTTTYRGNISHDQSLAVTGLVEGTAMHGIAELWQKNAMEAIRLKMQAKESVNGALPEFTIFESSKLTEKSGDFKPKGGEAKQET
ncbi:hypothetical protein SLS53_005725 [Cytospora paraplurivora]|uniref:Prion-inhibition and propagation HeLo domain-containing protein n=1 Tax=Cytospora paraplurivora TaxID=2898453 RepID=A0AAN9U553_9PEZI